MENQEITEQQFLRLVNNFYNSINYGADINRIATDSHLINYFSSHRGDLQKKYKVAMVFICLNPLYWEYAKSMVDSARQMLLPGHDTDFLFWTDIPEDPKEVDSRIKQAFVERGVQIEHPSVMGNLQNLIQGVIDLRGQKDITIFPTEPIEWPYPTLLRYNLFLQQEEKLKEYDYIFYCDIDMRFVNVVGDEILGEGLTAAQHPMYALRKEYNPPYEPNEKSACYIPRPGRVILENGRPRFVPLYFAGGFQGGKSEPWIESMKRMKNMIEHDLAMDYVPIWNDESAWNKECFDNPPGIVLSPSYIQPDSLIKEYYEPLWGCSYVPKLMTLTKWFSLSAEGGAHVQQMIKQIK